MVWLGLAEDSEDEYEEAAEATAPRRADDAPDEPSNVRRITPTRTATRMRLADEERSERPLGRASAVSHTTVHYTEPSTFNDVEEVGDRFRSNIPVIMNLATASESVAKRVLDFASGLIYGLDGRIERVGERVFLLTPQGVEFSTEERRKLSERGFFNQA